MLGVALLGVLGLYTWQGPPGVVSIIAYRTEGSAWIANLANSNAADATGQANYLRLIAAAGGVPNIYPSPVVAEYSLSAFDLDNTTGKNNSGYAECPECKGTSTCPEEAPPRTCHGGSETKVGVKRTDDGGLWYSLPAASQCHLGQQIGIDCRWRIDLVKKVVDFTCLRTAGCGDDCTEEQFSHAFSACPDVGAANSTHYRDPASGCLVDEIENRLPTVAGSFCSAACLMGGTYCPPDVPIGVTARPTCMVSDPIGNGRHCALQCQSDAECGRSGHCSTLYGSDLGICIVPPPPKIDGVLQLVYGKTCPKGWAEKKELEGLLLTGAPGGSATAGTNNKQPAMTQGEVGRVGPHGHEVYDAGHGHDVNDPGHTHTFGALEEMGGQGGDTQERLMTGSKFMTGSSKTSVTIKRSSANITVKNNTGSHYPLAYVLVCERTAGTAAVGRLGRLAEMVRSTARTRGSPRRVRDAAIGERAIVRAMERTSVQMG